MPVCLNCGRTIKRGRSCSALACVVHAQRQERIDERARALNPRKREAQPARSER